jgi:serine/threonine-protein phosphatase 5
LDPQYIKAYYRRASANYALGKLKDAKRDLTAVVRIVPKDPDAQKKVCLSYHPSPLSPPLMACCQLKACEKAIREEAFNKAIESELSLHSSCL